MDAQQFLAEFGHIANAPGGVNRLRELIFALAFKGELCPHSDESSDALVRDLERQRLDFNGETRKQRLTRLDNGTEKSLGPYEIPEHWSWVSLSTVGHTWGQKKPNAPFVYIDVSSIDNKAGVISQAPEVINPDAAPSRARKIVKAGTLIYSTIRPYLLNVAIVDRNFEFETIASTAFAVIHPWKGVSTRFLYLYLRSLFFVKYVENVQTGMAYPAISDEKFYSGVIPLPPAEEQLRIVAKVDELMALCDTLEGQQQTRRKIQNNLRKSILQALADAQSPNEMQIAWARLEENFGRLFSVPEDVDEIIAVIMNLAARGLLSKKTLDKVNSRSIMKSCADIKSSYVRTGIMRRQKIVAMAECETAYPEHWSLSAFDEVGIVIGGVTKGRNLQGKQKTLCPYLAVANVQRGYFAKLNKLKTIEIATTELEKYKVEDGDLLITEGGDWDKVGRTAIWKGTGETCLHQNHVFKARIPSDLLLNTWVELVFNSGVGREYFAGASKQTTNLASINMTQLRSFPLPIPPIQEQQAILATVTKLSNQCSRWKKQLARKLELACTTAQTMISELTGVDLGTNKDNVVKLPQTELIAILRSGTTPDIKTQAPLATLLARHNGEMLARDLWQRFGGEIDAFYAQLKTEVSHGWIQEPTVAEVREKVTAPTAA